MRALAFGGPAWPFDCSRIRISQREGRHVLCPEFFAREDWDLYVRTRGKGALPRLHDPPSLSGGGGVLNREFRRL
jgi:hypothetical protein